MKLSDSWPAGGAFARTPSLGENWEENWIPRKMEMNGWARDFSVREHTA